MVENQMVVYHQERMTMLQSQDVAAYYAERRRMPIKPADKPCITAPSKGEGSKFHARG